MRRAGQVHDLGMVSVPNRVWIKRAPLNPAEAEFHGYLGLAIFRPVARRSR